MALFELVLTALFGITLVFCIFVLIGATGLVKVDWEPIYIGRYVIELNRLEVYKY